MNKTEQGVLQQSKLKYLLIHILLLLIFCLTYPAFAETRTTDTAPPEKNTKKHHVFIIFSPDNILHSSIVQMLSDNLNNSRSDITISKVTPEEKIKNETKATIRLIPIDGKMEDGKCIYTGKPSEQRVVFAKAY